MSITAGSLFLRNFILGFFLVFISLITFRTFELGGSYSAVITGVAFFFINCAVLILYTLAILRNEELLAQEDSADYAYYLGFCLTVLTLAISFGYDAVSVKQNTAEAEGAATQASALVKSALIQFAAGLFATVLGLCAKIYITSQQSLSTTEPEELYRRFRHEIHEFQTELRSAVTGISASFKQVSDDLSASAQQVNRSVGQLVSTIDETSKDLGTMLSKMNLDRFTSDFLRSANNLKEASSQLSSSAESITTALSQLSNVSVITNANISNLGVTVSAFDTNSKLASDSLEKYTESLLHSISCLAIKGENLTRASDQLEQFAVKSESLIQRISPLEDFFSVLDDSAKSFSLSVSNIGGAVDNFQNRVKVIETALVSLGAVISASTSASDKLTRSIESNANLNDANVDTLMALSAAQSAFEAKMKSAALSVDLLSQETKALSEFLPLVGTMISNVNLDELEMSLRKLNEASKTLAPTLNTSAPIIDQLKKTMSLLVSASNDHKQTLEDLDGALNILSSNSLVIQRNIGGINTELEKLKDFLPLFGQAMSSVDFANLSRSINRLADESNALAAELRSKNTSL